MPKGGITIPLFHCFFIDDGSVKSFMHHFDIELYESLQNLYAICVASEVTHNRKIVAGLFIKTSLTHVDPEFGNVLAEIVVATPRLQDWGLDSISFFPARLGIKGSSPPSEDEMLRIIFQQYIKYSTSGNA